MERLEIERRRKPVVMIPHSKKARASRKNQPCDFMRTCCRRDLTLREEEVFSLYSYSRCPHKKLQCEEPIIFCLENMKKEGFPYSWWCCHYDKCWRNWSLEALSRQRRLLWYLVFWCIVQDEDQCQQSKTICLWLDRLHKAQSPNRGDDHTPIDIGRGHELQQRW